MNENNNNNITHTVGKIHSINCGHCIQFAPKWKEMKEMLKGGNHNINIVEFETTRDANKLQDFNNDLQKKYNNQLDYTGVPTMFKISGGGKIEYYEGKREPEIMKQWVLNNRSDKKNGGRKRITKVNKFRNNKKTRKIFRKIFKKIFRKNI